MSKSFLIIAIGPIQDFIASARRCRDLWYGSWLLSHLAEKVARVIQQEAGVDSLIFPGSQELRESNGISNKIVALVPTEKVQEIVAIAKDQMECCLLEQLEHATSAARNDSRIEGYLHYDVAVRQVKEMMEFFWVAIPCQAMEGETYSAARNRAEELLAARKNTHDWGAVSWGANVPKSSLDGARESVLDESLYDSRKTEESLERRVYRTLKLKRQERLCGVGLLKRLGRGSEEQDVFHSTPHMASMSLRGFFERQEVKEAFDTYINDLSRAAGCGFLREEFRLSPSARPFQGTARKNGYDGGVFFLPRVWSAIDDYADHPEEAKKGAETALRKFFRSIREDKRPLPEPSPYYVLLLADGDRMGVLIDEQNGFEAHKRLSRSLDNFAGSVEEIVSEHDGSLIYAGGDDVLALLPLHRAVPCAKTLADSFALHLKPFATEGDSNTRATLSVGLAIAHHMTPFGFVRELAKEAERLAKRKRNSLAIIFDKRSGGKRSVSGSWEKEGELSPIHKRLATWQDFIEQQEVNHGFLHEVESIARFGRVEGTDQGTSDIRQLNEMMIHELARVMSRKVPDPGKRRGLGERVASKFRQFIDGLAEYDEKAEPWQALADELYIALELARESRLLSSGE
jgi:CRISPR-associated protein Cmr2